MENLGPNVDWTRWMRLPMQIFGLEAWGGFLVCVSEEERRRCCR